MPLERETFGAGEGEIPDDRVRERLGSGLTSLPHRRRLSYSRSKVTADEPTHLECPDCGTPIVLLPLKLYSGREEVDPGEVFDVAGHTMEVMFAIVDDEGYYRCPACQRQHRAQP